MRSLWTAKRSRESAERGEEGATAQGALLSWLDSGATRSSARLRGAPLHLCARPLGAQRPPQSALHIKLSAPAPPAHTHKPHATMAPCPCVLLALLALCGLATASQSAWPAPRSPASLRRPAPPAAARSRPAPPPSAAPAGRRARSPALAQPAAVATRRRLHRPVLPAPLPLRDPAMLTHSSASRRLPAADYSSLQPPQYIVTLTYQLNGVTVNPPPCSNLKTDLNCMPKVGAGGVCV